MEEQGGNSRKKIVLIAIVVLLLIVGGILAWFLLGNKGGGLPGTVGDLFGDLGVDVPRPQGDVSQPNWGGGTNNPDNVVPGTDIPRLRKISSFPSVGHTEYLAENGSHKIRYMEPERGNIYDIDIVTGKEERVTNTTVPRVHSAHFGTNGRTVVLRFLDAADVIKTQIRDLVIGATSSSADVPGTLSDGQFLADNIDAVSLSPDGQSLFYLVHNEKFVAKGQTLDLASRVGVSSFEFPFSEWVPEILDGKALRFTTRSSGLAEGYSYAYNAQTKKMRRVVGDIKGLTTKYSPSGKTLLYSAYSTNGVVLDYITDPKNEEADHIVVGFSTLPEKCAWSSGEQMIYCGADDAISRVLLPDTWYKGLMYFDDTLWSFDTTRGTSEMLVSPKDLAGESIDVVDPFVTEDDKTLIFKNKRDGMLWALTLPRETQTDVPAETSGLTPEEAKDAGGSLPREE